MDDASRRADPVIVYTDNVPVIALYQRISFIIEGTHRRVASREGGYVDAHTMACLRHKHFEYDD